MDFQNLKSTKSKVGGRKRKSGLAGGVVKKPKLENIDYCSQQYVRPLECGWKREIVIRSIVNGVKSEGRSADVYYYPPKGKKLRSMTEVISYLQINDTGGRLSKENFSFRKDPLTPHSSEYVRNARVVEASPNKSKTRNLTSMVRSPVANDSSHQGNTPNSKNNSVNSNADTPNNEFIKVGLSSDVFHTPYDSPNLKLPRKWGRPRGSKNKSKMSHEGNIKIEGSDKKIITSKEKTSMENILCEENDQPLTRSKRRKSLIFSDYQESNDIPQSLSEHIQSSSTPSSAVISVSSSSSSLSSTLLTSSPSSSLLILPSPTPTITPPSFTPLNLCNLRCPGLENICPSLECKRCKCLFHPECVGNSKSETEFFYCQVCKSTTTSSKLSTTKPILTNSNVRMFSNILRSMSQKYKNISPAITSTVTTSPTSVSSALSSPLENFVQNAMPTQTAQLNLPSFTIPLYAGNNQISYPSSNNYLPSYFLMPQPFMNSNPIGGCPPTILTQNVLRTSYNTGSLFPSVCLQTPSTTPVLGPTLNFQPLNQLYQTFTLTTQPISALSNNSLISQGVITPSIENIEIRSEVDHPSSRPLNPTKFQPQSNSKLVPLKKRIKEFGKNSSNIETMPTDANDCIADQPIRAVPSPIFVHDGKSKSFESTILSNGVVSKIMLPTYDIFGAPIISDSESPSNSISSSLGMPVVSSKNSGPSTTLTSSITSTVITTTSSMITTDSLDLVGSIEPESNLIPSDANLSIGGDQCDEGISSIPIYTNSSLNSKGVYNGSTPHNGPNEGDGNDNDVVCTKENDGNNEVCTSENDNVSTLKSRCSSNDLSITIEINSYSDFTLSKSHSKEIGGGETLATESSEVVAMETSPTSIDNTLNLDCSLLRKIFGYLTTFELLVTSLVCKRWSQIIQSKDLWMSLDVTDELLDDITPDLSEVLHFSMLGFKPQKLNLRRINLEVVNVCNHVAKFSSLLPSEISTDITVVTMGMCPPRQLKQINDAFPHVDFLSLTLKGRQVKSKKVESQDDDDDDDDDARNLVENLTDFRCLKTLQIYEEEPRLDDLSPACLLTPANGEELETKDLDDASQCFPELEELRLFGSSHPSLFKKTLLSCKYDKLSFLTISDCRGWNDKMFSLLGNFKDLLTLDLRRGGNIPDLGLSHALGKMTRLHELRLSDYILDLTLSSSIQKLSSLRNLHMRPDTSLSSMDKAPYINLCCMSAIWNLRDLRKLTWETSVGPDGSLPFQMCDTTKLKNNVVDVDEKVVASGGRLLFLNVNDLLLKLHASLPNTKVKIQVV